LRRSRSFVFFLQMLADALTTLALAAALAAVLETGTSVPIHRTGEIVRGFCESAFAWFVSPVPWFLRPSRHARRSSARWGGGGGAVDGGEGWRGVERGGEGWRGVVRGGEGWRGVERAHHCTDLL
jgi:hypothetical protein